MRWWVVDGGWWVGDEEAGVALWVIGGWWVVGGG